MTADKPEKGDKGTLQLTLFVGYGIALVLS